MKLIILIILISFNMSNTMEKSKKAINLEFQYFEGCPHYITFEKNIESAIKEYKGLIDFKKIEINTIELAKINKFRGSPTLLINGVDFENAPEIKEPGLTCRYYSNGVPSSKDIIQKLDSLVKLYK